MSITSLKFIIPAIISAFIFYLLNPKLRNGYLALLSCGFIASLNYLLLPYILIYSLINFYIGIKLPLSNNKTALFRSGLIINLTQLIILRYSSFAIDPVFSLLSLDLHLSRLSEILLPVGISYFTLQGIGYLVNIKMGWEKPETKFLDFLLYITFFPKFLSGPIERSNHFLPQLKVQQSFSESGMITGFRTILIGLFKKVAIANQLAPYVISTYSDIGSVSSGSVWIILLLQPLYLYFDFSGYTDIAIGFARMFGIELLPNFNRPFFSHNMTTFWKRFHISLSSWFNDYIFRQTSFRLRKWGVYASIIGLLVTWTLFGIWHGAGWPFMLLGLLQALVIIYEFFTKKWRTYLFSKMPERIGLWTGRAATYLFYCTALVFFFAPDLRTVTGFFGKLLRFNFSISLDGISTLPFMLIIYIPFFLFLELLQEDFRTTWLRLENFWQSDNSSRYFRWAVYSLIITILFIAGLKDQQFVYANF
jgi:D-alanyl-lipoteichoic acid acyltransferase DltB (MBOAT superfamily)